MNIHRHRLRPAVALMSVLALGALAACGSGSGAATTATGADPSASSDGLAGVDASVKSKLEALYEKAKASGHTTINLYSAYAPSDPNKDLGVAFRTFETTFPGLTVNATLLSGSQLFTRVDGEFSSGKHTADAVLSGPSDVGYFIGEDRLTPYDPPTTAKLSAAFKEPNHLYNVPFQSLFGLVYNTNLVKPGEAPTTLAGLLDDKWKGKITFGQPNGVSPTDFSLATLKDSGKLNVDQLKQLNDLVPLSDRYASVVDAVNAVAQGRYAIAIWGPSQEAASAKASGAPIAVGSLTDAWVLNGPGYGVFQDAPDPEAAELLEAWLFTPTAQQEIADSSYNYGTLPGSPAPPDFPDVSAYSLKTIPAKDFASLLKSDQPEWTSIFGDPKS